MAIEYRGHATASTDGNTDTVVSLTALTGGLGSTALAGDLVLVYVGKTLQSDATTSLDTAGYTKIADLYANDNLDANLAVFWKIMGGTPDTEVRYSSVGNAAENMHVRVFKGVDQTTPIDVTTTTVTGTNASTVNPPSITPVSAGAWVVVGGCHTVNDSAVTPPTTVSQALATANGATWPGGAVSGIVQRHPAGVALDIAAWGGITTTTADSWAAASVALRPAAEDISFVGKQDTVIAAGGGTVALNALTGGIGTAAAIGDLVLLIRQDGLSTSDITFTVPSGYSLVAGAYGNGSAFDINVEVFAKYLTAADTSITIPSHAQATECRALVFRGVNPTTRFDVATVTASGTGNDANPPSITPANNGSMIIAVGSLSATPGQIGTMTWPSNLPYLLSGFGTNSTSLAGWVYQNTAGAFDPNVYDVTFADATYAWAALTIALRNDAIGTGGNIKVWNGSAWVVKPVKVWNGSAWVTKPLKRWNGSAWVTTPY